MFLLHAQKSWLVLDVSGLGFAHWVRRSKVRVGLLGCSACGYPFEQLGAGSGSALGIFISCMLSITPFSCSGDIEEPVLFVLG